MFRLTVLVVLLAAAYGAPRSNRPVPAWQQARRQNSQYLTDAQVSSVLLNAPKGARLIATSPPIQSLESRLPANATQIRPNFVDSFSCEGRNYGYYGDVDNDCQVFHVCLPLRQLYPANFTSDVTYLFSFICPKATVFTQDAMVCAWENEAVPCDLSPELYKLNDNFFRRVPNEDGFGERYAHVNEKF